MKDDESLLWLYSNKHLNIGLPPSIIGSTSALVSFAIITILILNCWWFLLLPREPDLLIPDSYTHNDTSIHATLNHTENYPAPSGIFSISNNSSIHPARNHTENFPAPSGIFSISNDSSIHTTPNHTENSPAPSGLCDLSRGKWVPDTSPPLYTNDTCRYIQPSQNCLQNGRPDRGYLSWRWKPSDCELPPFDAALFLDLMRGKKVAFIGDSLARNHMQALQCALAQVEDPLNLFSDPRDKEYRWLFSSYNFTLTNLWSPFLVNYTVQKDLYKLYLDIPEMVWSSQLAEYDIAIISTGYWYFRKSLYHVNKKILGASPGAGLNVTTVELLSAMRIVLGNVLKHMSTEYQGLTMLRTVTVDHFEHGAWSNGGMCNRTHPFSTDIDVPPLPWMNKEIKTVQVEEFEKAMAYVKDASKLKLLDVTDSAYLRPDGHPGPYRIHHPNEPPNDCLHWCLPGPIDMWNQLVLHTLQPIFIRQPLS